MKIPTTFMNICTFITFTFLLTTLFMPIALTEPGASAYQGFSKGVSNIPVVPLRKAIFVNYDEQSYLDDYAFLAAVPTAVFCNENQLISNPLLFYQDEYTIKDEKEKTLDAKVGIDYFMEDWLSFCGNRLDSIVGINVEERKLNEWPASEYISIEGDNAFDLASAIALHDWSYSKKAVLAVIEEEFEDSTIKFSNHTSGIFPREDIHYISTFNIEQSNSLNPVYQDFTVDEKYQYIKAEAWWDGLLLGGSVMIPTGDPDLQLYCKEDGQWMQTAAVAQWNIYSPPGHEYTYSPVYKPGDWKIGITDFPTESEAPRRNILGGLFTIQGSLLKALGRTVTYHVDVSLYPGIKLTIPDVPPFGCRDASFKLTWNDPNICLGFSLIGPSGEVIHTALNESRTDYQKIEIHQLGDLLPGEYYSISVFSLDDIPSSIKFDLEYEWEQQIFKEEGSALASATEGAVLASRMNAPLLYTKKNVLPQVTLDALLQLGVKDITIMDIGKDFSLKVRDEIKSIFNIQARYTTLQESYDNLRNLTGSNDVIFSTIDPWTSWYMKELEPGEETEAGLFIGPAAYLAAHHGSPVLLVDMHPELSSAVTWHTQFWRSHVAERYENIPTVADMVLTGRRVYDFLQKHDFDQVGREIIVTVAGQYDIGIPWDRVFVGEAQSGRFWGTPVDTAYWIDRSVFYPALIFTNPALKSEHTISLINGSISERKGFRGLLQQPLLNSLVITQQSQEEDYEYPVLCSFVTHKYRFNERASEYYGSKYQCADGLIPGETNTMSSIDQGVNEKYYGETGSYFPDMTESEVIPFYLNKGGFDTAFSTQLESVMDNLNQGVILWIHASHGIQQDGGTTLFWDPDEGFASHPLLKFFAGAAKEENPWRGYDWELGSTQEPDTMSMDYRGFWPLTNIDGPILPATGLDYVLARKPVRERLNQLLDIIRIIPFRFQTENLYDGLTGTLSFSKYPLAKKNSTQMEELMDNLHSAGFITSICQTSNTYFHLMMIRHGSVFQVQDPWPTSWYGAIWRQSIPRDIILGATVGEAYVKGMSHVGILYLGDNGEPPQWWWDSAENVVYFGDPNLRMYVPNTEYSDANNWERPEAMRYNEDIIIQGHMPFGATSHPKEMEPPSLFNKYFIVIVACILIVILLVLIILINRKK